MEQKKCRLIAESGNGSRSAAPAAKAAVVSAGGASFSPTVIASCFAIIGGGPTGDAQKEHAH